MHRVLRGIAAALATTLLVVSGASAKPRTTVPAGNPAANQYLEVVPTASGGKPSQSVSFPTTAHAHQHGTGAGAGAGSLGASLPRETRTAFAGAGHSGLQATLIAGATAPSGGEHGRIKPGGGAASAVAPASTAPNLSTQRSSGDSALSQVFGALGGSTAKGGLGAALPAILAVSLIAVLAVAARNHRRRST